MFLLLCKENIVQLLSKKNSLILFIISLSSSLTINGQNLVLNGDFENTKSYKCYFNTPEENIGDYVYNWYTPTIGSTDIWFIDSLNNKECSQNLSKFGIKPKSGNVCIGLYTLSENIPNYREYAQIKLIKPLVKGKSYVARFNVRLYKNYSGASTNNLGITFSKDILKGDNGNSVSSILTSRKVAISESTILANSSDWVEVRGCFTADDSYNYLTLGNFFSDEQTKVEFIDNLTLKQAYYFIDDVSVEEQAFTLPSLNLGKDTTLCNEQKLYFILPANNSEITWQDGNKSNVYTINKAGEYRVTLRQGECEVSDTLNVMVLPPIRLPNDTLLCRGQQIILNPHYTYESLQWSSGSTDSILTISESGIYFVKVNSPYCTISDSITVQVEDCPSFVPNVFTPNGDGVNDRFLIQNNDFFNWNIEIYNRWGRRVYKSIPYKNDWDGDDLPTGLYYYYLFSEKHTISIKGWVQLLR